MNFFFSFIKFNSIIFQISTSVEVIIQKISSLLIDFEIIAILVDTFPEKMAYCASKGPLSLIDSYYSNVVSKIPECIGKIANIAIEKLEDINE